MLHRRLLASLVVVLASVACAGDDDATGTTTTTEGSTTTSSAPATTTTTLVPRGLGSAGNDTDDGPRPVPLDDLVVGDCVNFSGFPDPDLVELDRAVIEDCERPHDAQIYGQLLLTEDLGDPYPGDAEVLTLADAACLAEFESYVGRRYVDTRYEIVHLRPNEAAWRRGDPSVVCAVINASFEPLVGSLMQPEEAE
ncbi:MAG: septum formation family protein [Acidimicrobiales bacterium]